jgi:hypothetical protein
MIIEERSMFVRHCLTIFAAACAFLLAPNVWATSPSICDPQEDPDQCECPNDGTYDVCYETAVSALISPDDPEVLREAAGITSQWDSQTDTFEVTADVTDLTAAGVMKLNSNQGQWDSVEELHDYIGALIGQDFSDFIDACEIGGLPPMSIAQVGSTTRYDQFNEEWAAANSGSIIYDAITNENGVLFIGANSFNLFGQGSRCTGADPKSHEFDKDSKLAADQCSDVSAGSHEMCGELWGSDPCFPECRTYSFELAWTDLETSSTQSFGDTLECRGDWIGGELVCTPSQGVIVHGRVQADDIYLENTYFSGISNSFTPDPVEAEDEVEVSHDSSAANGVCGYGEVEDGLNSVELETRDGAYDSQEDLCDF